LEKREIFLFLPLRAFESLVALPPVSSLRLARFCRKGKNEKLDILSAISNARFDVVDVIIDDADNGLDGIVVAVTGGIAGVAIGRTPRAVVGSTGTAGAGFLINDKNRCRHKSSGMSELSTSNSRNCRKPW
jgi:hypothetical protein